MKKKSSGYALWLIIFLLFIFLKDYIYIIGIILIGGIIIFAIKLFNSKKTKTKDNTWYCHKCGTTNNSNDLKCVECGFLHKESNPVDKPVLNHTTTPSSKPEPLNIKKEDSYPVTETLIKSNSEIQPRRFAYVSALKEELSEDILKQLKSQYIAFDVETTGLDPYEDRIIEIGAVLFENEVPIKEFGTLVNPNRKNFAVNINHITDEMISNAPSEDVAYKNLIDFLGGALERQILICAHNAKFDMDFLSQTLMRLGYSAKISYVDTLSISRHLIPRLDNYKQPTLAEYFEIPNEQFHRAILDAKVCGTILSKLLAIKNEQLQILKQKEEEKQNLRQELAKKRDTVTINPTHTRVPLTEILNLNDWDKGYNQGYSFWETGETLRKGGDLELALQLFDKARYNGYCSPALYSSYAKTYRQLKDYENEIAILDEAVSRLKNNDDLEERRYKTVCLLIKQREKIQQEQEKLQKKQEKQVKSIDPVDVTSKKTSFRAILQFNDEMELIKRYESIAEAVRETGINSKSMRSAASGVQKHAGGFVWRYADEYEIEKEQE